MKRLIVGLGNPGREYEYTRHNFGFLVLEEFARKHHLKFAKSNLTAGLMAKGEVDDQEVVLLLPTTFVNNSGTAVKSLMVKKEIPASEVLIVCDDVNLDFGQMRIRDKGSAGGHNGLKSVIKYLQTQEFARLRVGVGSPKTKDEMVDFVLSEFTSPEKKALPTIMSSAMECCRLWLGGGTTEAMKQFNQKEGR